MSELISSLMIAEPGSVIKSVIKILHLIGIVLGLGAATVLDIVIIRYLGYREDQRRTTHLVEFISKIVTLAGLIILWFSGASYLAHYAAFDPEKLGNQKVWAKIAIVAVLTINGYSSTTPCCLWLRHRLDGNFSAAFLAMIVANCLSSERYQPHRGMYLCFSVPCRISTSLFRRRPSSRPTPFSSPSLSSPRRGSSMRFRGGRNRLQTNRKTMKR